MKKYTIALCVSLILLLFCFISCDNNIFYDKSFNVEKKGWNISDKLHFNVDVSDTISPYNFYLKMRHTVDFPYQNAFFFINTTFPDGSIANDTLECLLSDAEGHWLGKSSGKLIDNHILFKPHVIFPMSGMYKFEIVHGMRELKIQGLSDIGLQITYSNKK